MERPEIGDWSVLKNEIIDKYTQAYLAIMNNQEWCRGTIYVDAFAGATENINRSTQELVPGSAKRALEWDPGFTEYYFVDTNPHRVEDLRALAHARENVQVFHEDGNAVLREHIIPRLQRRHKRRGFILLDPYGLQLDWDVVKALGQTNSADVAINFPTMAINRNSARRDRLAISEIDAERMTQWWGSEVWKNQFYGLGPKLLAGEPKIQKRVNDEDIVGLYRERLRNEGSYEFVTEPLAMKNTKNATIYYILLASNNANAVKIMNEILAKYRKPHTKSFLPELGT